MTAETNQTTVSSNRSTNGQGSAKTWSLPNWQAAALAALLVGLIVAPLAFVGFRRSADRIESDLSAWSDEQMAQAVSARFLEQVDPPPNAWLVNPTDQWAQPLSEDIWTSPPLFRLAEDAIAYGVVRTEYEFDGQWFAHARAIDGNNALVLVLDANGRDSDLAKARQGWLAAAILAMLAAAAIGWLVASSLRRQVEAPVERAHSVNRDFIADAAHELRTPLSIIQASAGHALSRDRSVGEYQESLSEILTAAERAGSSVSELLEFARFEAGQASLRLAPLRLDLLVEEVAVSVRADNTTVEVAPSQAIVVEADYNLVRQVVDNLTRNAVARADKVTLSAVMDGQEARVDVVDNGPGFDPGVIDYVFERFRRGDRSGSAGLGMAIARTIVELHHGRCAATNLVSSTGELDDADEIGDEIGDVDEIGGVDGARVSFWLPLT